MHTPCPGSLRPAASPCLLALLGAALGCGASHGASTQPAPRDAGSDVVGDARPVLVGDASASCPYLSDPPGWGITGFYASSDLSAGDPGVPGAEWPSLHANSQRTSVVETTGSHLTHPVAVWRYPVGQSLNAGTGWVGALLGDGTDYVAVQGGRVVVRRADGSVQARSDFLDLQRLLGVADMDGSGKLVILASAERLTPGVYVIDATTGVVISSVTNMPPNTGVLAGSIVDDVNGDGLPDLAIWAQAYTGTNPVLAEVYTFASGDASPSQLWSTHWDGAFVLVNDPVVADLLGTGKPQLLAMPQDGRGSPILFDGETGAVLAQIGTTDTACVGSALRVIDVDSSESGKKQIVVVTDGQTYSCNAVSVFDVVPSGAMENGNVITCGAAPNCITERWSAFRDLPVTQISFYAPWEDLISDLDGTGHVEIVYGVYDSTVGSWTTEIRDAATGTVLTTIANEVPFGIVPSGVTGSPPTVLSLSQPFSDIASVGTVTARSFTRAGDRLSTLWTKSDASPVWRSWRPTLPSDHIANGNDRSGAGQTIVQQSSGAVTVVLATSSGAVKPGGRADMLVVLDAVSGTSLAPPSSLGNDVVTGYQQAGTDLWLSSSTSGIEHWTLEGTDFSNHRTVPGGAYTAPPARVKRNGALPEIYFSDAVGDTHVLSLPSQAGGCLVERARIPWHQTVLALVDVKGDGKAEMLVEETLGAFNALELVARDDPTPLWTVPLATPTMSVEWADFGNYGPAPGVPGFVVQMHDSLDEYSSALTAFSALTGSVLWHQPGQCMSAGRGGSMVDYNGDGVDDEVNSSSGNDSVLYDGTDGHVVLDLDKVSNVGLPVNVAVGPGASPGTFTLFTGGNHFINQSLVTAWSVDKTGKGTELWTSDTDAASAPGLLDVNGDGVLDAVYWEHMTNNIVARDGQTGAMLWREGLEGGKVVPFAVGVAEDKSDVAVADIADDGIPKVLLTTEDGWLYALNTDGSIFLALDFEARLSSPIVADLSGKGDISVVVAADDGSLYFLMQASARIAAPQ
jgi:hypothetical protein